MGLRPCTAGTEFFEQQVAEWPDYVSRFTGFLRSIPQNKEH